MGLATYDGVDNVSGGGGVLAPLLGDERREEVDHGARADEREDIEHEEALAREELGVLVHAVVLELRLCVRSEVRSKDASQRENKRRNAGERGPGRAVARPEVPGKRADGGVCAHELSRFRLAASKDAQIDRQA